MHTRCALLSLACAFLVAGTFGCGGGSSPTALRVTPLGVGDGGTPAPVGTPSPVRDSGTTADTAPSPAPTPSAVSAPVCSYDGWCWTNPLPQANPLAAVWGASPSDIWSVGTVGT